MTDAVSYVDNDDSNVVMPQRRTPVSQDNEDLVVKGKAPASLFLDLQKRQKKHSEAGQVNGSIQFNSIQFIKAHFSRR